MRHVLRLILPTLVMILLGVTFVSQTRTQAVVVAQQPDSCPALVDEALMILDENCDLVDRNSACYGFNRIETTFTDDVPEEFFTLVGDQAGLSQIATIQTSVFNLTQQEWGIALLKMQANLPNTLPGQAVTMLLLGDVEVEDAVEPGEAFESDVSVTFTTVDNVGIWPNPDNTEDVLDVAPTGSTLEADAINPEGDWVRVAFGAVPGWARLEFLETDADASELPVLAPDAFTPMQAFYFTTGIGRPACEEAPTSLVVQGPQEVAVDFTANGANMRVTSTVALATIGDDMVAFPVTGTLITDPGTPDEMTFEVGEVARRCLLDEPEDLGVDGVADNFTVDSNCPWEMEEITPGLIDRIRTPSLISQRNPNFNYALFPDELEDMLPESSLPMTPIAAVVAADLVAESDCETPDGWAAQYTVQSGDTINEIADLINAFSLDIAGGNCLANPDLIVPGQVLFLPREIPVPTAIPLPTSIPMTPVDVPPPLPTPTPLPLPTPTPLPLPTPTPLPPPTMFIVSGDGQTSPYNAAYAAPLIVQINDGFGNPVIGQSVTFTAGGNVTFGGPVTFVATTNAAGQAVTPNPVPVGTCASIGLDTLTVTSVGFTPLNFNLTNTNATLVVTNPAQVGVGTLDALVTAACSGDTIDVPHPGYVMAPAVPPIIINKDLTIFSSFPGGTSISGNNTELTALFVVGGATVNLSGLILAETLDRALSVSNVSVVNVTSSEFFNNTGVAIFVDDAFVTINDTSFNGNFGGSVIANGPSLVDFTGNNSIVLEASPNCSGAGTFTSSGLNFGGDGTCYP